MKSWLLAVVALCAMATTGCIKPYDVPEFVEIQHHETGYLIPLEGASKDGQKKFDSIEALDQNRVAIKRIQIPHRWVATGRLPSSGEYIDTVRLVVVNRSPVTREWTADTTSGTDKANQAIWLESRDSIGFSLGFNCTAFIDEPDATTFLYWYPTTTTDKEVVNIDKSTTGLAHTMDKEIRARVQMLANQVAAKYDLDDLRARKAEILNAVRNGIPEEKDANGNIVQEKLEGVISHFERRGITITNLGQFGGFEYSNAEIQKAINATFVAQQEKVVAEAAFEAQAKKNERVELEAEAMANKSRTLAKGEADAVAIAAEAEAKAIASVAQAAKEAGEVQLFLELKRLEVQDHQINKWDGQFPKTVLGQESNILFSLPPDAEVSK